MSDWSQDSADLFAAGRTLDEPSAEDRDRVALRIAARIAVAGGGAAVVSLATPLATPLVAAPAALAKGGAALSLAKVLLSLAVGVGAVTAATAAVVVIARSSAAPRPVEVQVPAAAKVPVPGVVTDRRTARMPVPPPEPVEPVVVAPVTLTAPLAAPLASPLPVIAPAPVHAAPAPVVSSTAMPAPMPGPAAASPSSAVASRPAEDTASEARLVRGIDEALRHHDVPTAQRLLDEHDATFPGGHFTEECAAARVLARCDALAGEDTSHAACTFFTQHPRSPMRARIEQACAPRCE